jgi:hypothetical protein
VHHSDGHNGGQLPAKVKAGVVVLIPWYRQKHTISYTDMLAALRRELIRQDFWAQAHPKTTNPKLT